MDAETRMVIDTWIAVFGPYEVWMSELRFRLENSEVRNPFVEEVLKRDNNHAIGRFLRRYHGTVLSRGVSGPRRYWRLLPGLWTP